MKSIISNSKDETLLLGKKIAPFLNDDSIIILTGDLGAGKTLFVTGVLDYFGQKDEVSSPTFTIVNEYNLENGKKFFHFDVYRLESSDEFLAIGGDEFFHNGICLIEWGEKISDVLPKDILKITIEKFTDDFDKRRFNFETDCNKYDELIRGIEA